MTADGPRYHALGNSWAVNVFKVVGARLTKAMAPIYG